MLKVFVFFTSLILQGCAITAITEQQKIKVVGVNVSTQMNDKISVEISCDGNSVKTHSAMVSPLIPLPPIIPLFINEPTHLFITYPETTKIESVSLSAAGNETIEFELIEQRSSYIGESLVLQYKIQGVCSTLNKAKLEVEFSQKNDRTSSSYSYELIYNTSGKKLEWGYLGA